MTDDRVLPDPSWPDQDDGTVARYWCPNCDEKGLYSMVDGARCIHCGRDAREPFRAGWDEAD